jgi:hypothetical protein
MEERTPAPSAGGPRGDCARSIYSAPQEMSASVPTPRRCTAASGKWAAGDVLLRTLW